MSQTQLGISEILIGLREKAPAGYAVGLHIQYTTTKFLFQTYNKDWLDYYSQNGLVMSDPIVAWCFENVGVKRWSELDDPAGVLKKASEYGMSYGFVFATNTGQTQSMAGFSRNDREFTDEEIAEMSATVEALHADTADQAQLTPETVQQLKNLSISFTHPGS